MGWLQNKWPKIFSYRDAIFCLRLGSPRRCRAQLWPKVLFFEITSIYETAYGENTQKKNDTAKAAALMPGCYECLLIISGMPVFPSLLK